MVQPSEARAWDGGRRGEAAESIRDLDDVPDLLLLVNDQRGRERSLRMEDNGMTEYVKGGDRGGLVT